MLNPDREHLQILSELFRDYLKGLRANPPEKGPIAPKRLHDDEYLKTHFLPPRPDPHRQPEIYRFWLEMLQIPNQWKAPTIDTTYILDIARAHRSTGSRGEQSANWSGAVARTFDYSHLTSIQGAWKVPKITLEPGTTTDAMCSMWIGFDGSDPASRSLPQIGTAQYFSFESGAPKGPYTAVWWEWFLRDSATNGYLTLPVPAKPGDHMWAQLTKIDATTVNFFIVNADQLIATPFQFQLPLGLSYWDDDKSEARVEANTAEWVLERPRQPGLRNAPLFAMPNFEHAAFHQCVAGTDSLNTPELHLTKAQLLQLVDWRPAPPGSRALSTPRRTGPHGLNFRNG